MNTIAVLDLDDVLHIKMALMTTAIEGDGYETASRAITEWVTVSHAITSAERDGVAHPDHVAALVRLGLASALAEEREGANERRVYRFTAQGRRIVRALNGHDSLRCRRFITDERVAVGIDMPDDEIERRDDEAHARRRHDGRTEKRR